MWPKFAVFDLEFRVAAARQNAVFVVDEAAVADDQVAFFEADAGTVSIGHAGAGEFDVLDGDVAAADHPDGFLFGAGTVGDQPDTPADTAKDKFVLLPDRDIA